MCQKYVTKSKLAIDVDCMANIYMHSLGVN